MDIVERLPEERIVCNPESGSKKRVFEMLSEALAGQYEDLNATLIFESLMSREKLGSTALGNGVAIPHGRCNDIDRAKLTMIKLATPVDFDAPDDQPVDLLVGLVVPEQATEEHLEILAGLAEMLSDDALTTRLRRASSAHSMSTCLQKWRKEKGSSASVDGGKPDSD